MLEVDELKAGYGRQDVLHGLSLPRWPPANSPRCWDRTAAASPRCSRRWRASSACAPGRRGWMAATLRRPIRPNARATSSTCRKACPPKSICGCSNPCWWPPAPATGWRPCQPAEIETLLERLGIAPGPALSGRALGRAEAAGRPGPGLDPPSARTAAGRAAVGAGPELPVPRHAIAAPGDAAARVDQRHRAARSERGPAACRSGSADPPGRLAGPARPRM